MPELTGLQYLVVSLLFEGEKSSNQLREELMRRGYTHNRIAFSRLMGRLISEAIVTYSICDDVPEGADSLERQNRYQVSNLGVKLWNASHEFYLRTEKVEDGKGVRTEKVSGTFFSLISTGCGTEKVSDGKGVRNLFQSDLDRLRIRSLTSLHGDPASGFW